jgi:hypothetical protein
MSTFLSICLYIFAACAALGLLPAGILAARARQPVMIVARRRVLRRLRARRGRRRAVQALTAPAIRRQAARR